MLLKSIYFFSFYFTVSSEFGNKIKYLIKKLSCYEIPMSAQRGRCFPISRGIKAITDI